MNDNQLIWHYNRISEAPDAVTRLRAFVIDLAVRGKLVPQDARDEPAKNLLKGINESKGEGSPIHPSDRHLSKHHLFELPSGWEWSHVGQVASKTGSGSTPRGGRSAYKTNGIKFLRSQNIHNDGLRLDDVAYIDKKTHERMSGTAVRPGDLLLNITGGSIGRCCHVVNEIGDANVSQHVAIIRPVVSEMGRFLHRVFLSPHFQLFIANEQTGAGRGGLPKNRMDQIPIPIPPLAEQHRIVAKIDELMALCDQLEKARADRETKRDKLTAATLARLNNPNPETFRNDARFALDNLDAITKRPDQIKQLRETILKLAVRGKLVPQFESEKPFEIKDSAAPSAAPFLVPKSWRWARLSSLGTLKGGGTPSKSRDDFWNGPIPWISPKDMKVDYIERSELGITDAAVSNSAVNLIDVGSLLFVVRGMILAHSFPVSITRVVLTINQDMKALTLRHPEMSEYLLRALKGLKGEMLDNVKRSSHGTCRLEGEAYRDFMIPIPPAKEQDRIVAKVNKLMAVCDELERALRADDATRSHLLAALLQDSLSSSYEPQETERFVASRWAPQRKRAS